MARVPDDIWESAILAWDFEQKDMYEEAIANFKKTVDLTSKDAPIFTPFFLAGLGHTYAVARRRSDAEGVLRDLQQRARQSYVSAFDIALIYIGLGDKDTAFAWMKKVVTERSTWLVYSKWEPRLAEKRCALSESTAPRRSSVLIPAKLERISARRRLVNWGIAGFSTYLLWWCPDDASVLSEARIRD